MFSNQLAVISGGSSGLGKELAKIMHKNGAHIVLLSRDKQKLEIAREEIAAANKTTDRIDIFSCDVSCEESVNNAFEHLTRKWGTPDILINSAGILKEGTVSELTSDTFRQVMGINFFGTLYCIKAVLPEMQKKGRGKIVNICSMAGRMGVYGYGAYCSSKHAVTGLTQTLLYELAQKKVTVHVAYPPEFSSPMVDELNTYRSPQNHVMVGTIPLMDVQQVAKEILVGVEKGQTEIIPGKSTRIVARLQRLFPGLAKAVSLHKIKKATKNSHK